MLYIFSYDLRITVPFVTTHLEVFKCTHHPVIPVFYFLFYLKYIVLKNIRVTINGLFNSFGHSHSMKNGLETRKSQRISVLYPMITWEVCWALLKMTVHSHSDWLKRC